MIDPYLGIIIIPTESTRELHVRLQNKGYHSVTLRFLIPVDYLQINVENKAGNCCVLFFFAPIMQIESKRRQGHVAPGWKRGWQAPNIYPSPSLLVCRPPRTKALLSHLSDEITPVSVARWGDGRDPGPCRRRGPHMYRQCVTGPVEWGKEGGGDQAGTPGLHAARSRRDTRTDPPSPSYHGRNPGRQYKKSTLALLACRQYRPMEC